MTGGVGALPTKTEVPKASFARAGEIQTRVLQGHCAAIVLLVVCTLGMYDFPTSQYRFLGLLRRPLVKARAGHLRSWQKAESVFPVVLSIIACT